MSVDEGGETSTVVRGETTGEGSPKSQAGTWSSMVLAV